MEKLKEFLSNGYCYGNGYGDCYGNGYGDGYGYGNGNGDGYGDGYCSGYGNGNGDGYGYCYGNGYGDGYGSGYGNGNGDGNGYGYCSGYGYGYGYGIKSINGMDVRMIDDTATIITHVHGDLAKGCILRPDMSLRPCYIAKGGGCFAHGDTARDACAALEEKIIADMDTEERIELFLNHFVDLGKKYPAHEFFEWHSKLTGSCLPGRQEFAAARDIDVDAAEYTVQEFIDLTRNAWGGEVIQELEERLK